MLYPLSYEGLERADRPSWHLARAWRLARLFGCMVVACPPAASRDDERRVDRRRGRACPARRGDRGRTGRGGARAPTATGARRSVFQRRARRRGAFGSRRPRDRRGPRGSAHRSRPAPRRSGGGGGAGIRQPARRSLVLSRGARRCAGGGARPLRAPRCRQRRTGAGRVRLRQPDWAAPRRQRLVRLVR